LVAQKKSPRWFTLWWLSHHSLKSRDDPGPLPQGFKGGKDGGATGYESKQSGRLEPSSALNQVDNQDDDRDYEQEVDQTAANVAEEAKKPEHHQDDNYSPEHGYPFG
jgi:hypothetical protein